MKVYTQKRSEQEAFSSIKEGLKVIFPVIKNWESRYIDHARVTGAFAKGTNVQGGADVDILISFQPEYPLAPITIYKNLFEYLKHNGYPNVRAHHISLRTPVNDLLVDLIPARQDKAHENHHQLFNRKTGDWTSTNFNQHTQLIATSGRLSEIRLMKLWRNQKNLYFPSFLLEMAVIDALKEMKPLHQTRNLQSHIARILTYLATDFHSTTLLDPSNPKNVISDDLLKIEKSLIANAAQKSLSGGWSSFMSA